MDDRRDQRVLASHGKAAPAQCARSGIGSRTRDEDIRTCASDLRSLAGYLWLAAGRTPAAGAAHDGVHGHTDAAAPLVSMDGRTISLCVWYVLYVVAVGARGSFVAQLASSAWLLPRWPGQELGAV